MSEEGENLPHLSPEKVDETLERVSSGVVLKAKVKRGSGTRDQDTVTGKIKGKKISEVEDQREDLIKEVKETADKLREINPDTGENSDV